MEGSDNYSSYDFNIWLKLNIQESKFDLDMVSTSFLYATICSGLVGLSGLFPVILLSLGNVSEKILRFMLSFACGGLLGDVFLHLLPEAYAQIYRNTEENEDLHRSHLYAGIWIIVGILTFVVVEMLCNFSTESNTSNDCEEDKTIKISGYLNLIANCIDNFAHGLAVGGAFLVDNKTGFITTGCILCHEIPHEIGDFAILMSSGFSTKDAAKAQLSTAFIGMIGAMIAFSLNSWIAIESYTSWIIPFTSGGFLNISLVAVLPDLVNSNCALDAFSVMSGIILGISVMMAVAQL